MKFILHAPYSPTGDQPNAIRRLTERLARGVHDSVLLGVTGSGKTYTIANVIEKMQMPTLVISHNKTLAAQLYQEFRDFFPENAVSYFVSYYDYYQPEAYIPQTDTYIEKETEINEEIDKLRLAATTNLLTRRDTIVVASVSCIYNIGSPREYGNFVLELKPGTNVDRTQVLERLVQLQYERNDFEFHRGTFRVRGETVDIYPAYEDIAIRITFRSDTVLGFEKRDPISGTVMERPESLVLYPAKHYMTDPKNYQSVFKEIRSDMERQVAHFKSQGMILEAHRISQRVNFDLEMIQEMGYVNGIENYSRYFDGRAPGDPPFTLLDYFHEAAGDGNRWLLVIDESHITVPQIRGMYNGDRARKQTLIDYGFRLPSALDNRPLRFDEFMRNSPQTVYVSATPDIWEISMANEATKHTGMINSGKDPGVVEQLIRPTGLVDPEISVRPTEGQISDLFGEIQKRKAKKQRILVTTLTKRMAEDLTQYLEERGVRVHYLHSDIETLKRTDILRDLREGTYDVVVGVNLLREGLDLPEVSLVVVLDADKEGFLRSRTSLIQTMGRAARHVDGQVILYATSVTRSMREAIEEVERRRKIQLRYNQEHGITPVSIVKPLREALVTQQEEEMPDTDDHPFSETEMDSMTPFDRQRMVKKLTGLMRRASREMRFEDAARFRDLIQRLKEV